MNFASDNTGPVHPQVMQALLRANEGHMPSYGADLIMEDLTARLRDTFEAPEAEVHLVATGTAANSLILATLCPPWGTAFCADIAHIQEDECNAPEFFTGGAKLSLIPSEAGKITPDALRARMAIEGDRGVHGPKPGPLSLTQVTERGTVYSVAELTELAQIAHDAGLPVHMDGARFANALVSLGCTPAEMTWRAGVDALTLGGTKNGLMGVEAVMFFDPAQADGFEFRRKRGAQLFSKHRFLAAQMLAAFTDDLWLDMAGAANAACARLAAGLTESGHATLLFEPDANMIFAEMDAAAHARLQAAGAQYHDWQDNLTGARQTRPAARLVCNWSTSEAEVDQFLAALAG